MDEIVRCGARGVQVGFPTGAIGFTYRAACGRARMPIDAVMDRSAEQWPTRDALPEENRLHAQPDWAG
ncbi:hypothetical protein AS149_34905 [Burkholderia cenocepacia]|nr:hypothetical protein AS149_34905 [Burkholderia cenocepacia]